MKKIAIATVCMGLFVASNAFAAPEEVQLADGFNAVGDTGTGINNSRQFTIQAIDDRAGFVKNDFDATLSANVIAGIVDEAEDNRLGVVAGSNRGYTVFTGSTVGGSVTQCGDQVAKDTQGLASSEVLEASVDLDNPNGCGRD